MMRLFIKSNLPTEKIIKKYLHTISNTYQTRYEPLIPEKFSNKTQTIIRQNDYLGIFIHISTVPITTPIFIYKE